MIKDWTVDTQALYKAADVEMDAVGFLWQILYKKQRVTFDNDNKIMNEYERCLKKVKRDKKGGSEFLRKWFSNVISKLAQSVDGGLQKRHQKALEKLKFDRDDWPFVGVCSRTDSKNLVAEESDYTEEVTKYLQKELNISVLSIQDSLNL